jgi:hypothetical protein
MRAGGREWGGMWEGESDCDELELEAAISFVASGLHATESVARQS